MKKITAVFLGALLLLSAAGCGNSNEANTTAAETPSGEVTQSVEAQDTSDEALDFLETSAPKFRKYIITRRTLPVTLETTIDNSDGFWTSNIYIKDSSHAVVYSKDPAGNETRVIYSGSMVYQIESAGKKMYSQELGEEFVTNTIKTYTVPLSFSDVGNAQYSGGTGKVEGIEYNCEAIQVNIKDSDGTVTGTHNTVYYFDKDTDTLVYTDSEGLLTKIDRIENVFDREDMFEIPEDYNNSTIDDLMQQYMDEEKAAAGITD